MVFGVWACLLQLSDQVGIVLCEILSKCYSVIQLNCIYVVKSELPANPSFEVVWTVCVVQGKRCCDLASVDEFEETGLEVTLQVDVRFCDLLTVCVLHYSCLFKKQGKF